MDLLEDLEMSLLNFNFVMIYIICKMLILLKNHMNYLKDTIFECFFKQYSRLLFKRKYFFSQHIMMESLSLKEENIIKDIKNLFRLKKEINCADIKDIRNVFKLEKEAKAIKDIILRDIKNLFEHEEEENYYKLVRESNFWSNNYIGYKSNGDTNKTLSVAEYLIQLDHI